VSIGKVRDRGDAITSTRDAGATSAVVRHSVPWIDLVCLPEVFFSQLGHAQVLEPASEDPMVKGIVRRELVALFFVNVRFFELA